MSSDGSAKSQTESKEAATKSIDDAGFGDDHRHPNTRNIVRLATYYSVR